MKNGKCKLTSKCLAAFSLDLLYLFFLFFCNTFHPDLPSKLQTCFSVPNTEGRKPRPNISLEISPRTARWVSAKQTDFLCADRVLGHIPLSTFICVWVYASEQPQWFQWSRNHTQIAHTTNPCWINKSGLLATRSSVMQQVRKQAALQHHTHWKSTQQGQVYWCSDFYIFFRK